MKRVFGLDRYTPTELVLTIANLYSLEMRLNLKLFVFVYRCLNGLSSSLLKDMYCPLSLSSHTRAFTRGQASSNLKLPTASSRYGYTSISFLGADRWNTLPVDCREARSLFDFIKHTKIHLGFPVKRLRSVGNSLER